MSGLKPRGFRWIIAGRLGVSERIGGYGFQHRRVRREEEILWISEQGVDAVFSLLASNQNQAAYESAGLRFYNKALSEEIDPKDVDSFFKVLDEALNQDKRSLLVHRDLIDDQVLGILGGYLVHSGLVEDAIIATSLIQEIAGRAIGPEGRKLIPLSN